MNIETLEMKIMNFSSILLRKNANINESIYFIVNVTLFIIIVTILMFQIYFKFYISVSLHIEKELLLLWYLVNLEKHEVKFK